jgi:putative ABC transport system ATP-binding protein
LIKETGDVAMPVLESHDVLKRFTEGRETVEVLRGVSLSLEAGEVVALEGPSGSGKTTLLSILGCILTPSEGRVVVNGETVDARRPGRLPEIRKKSIGFVFQQFNLFPALTALENVEYALNVKGIKGAAAAAEAHRVLSAVGLDERKSWSSFASWRNERTGGSSSLRTTPRSAPSPIASSPSGTDGSRLE